MSCQLTAFSSVLFDLTVSYVSEYCNSLQDKLSWGGNVDYQKFSENWEQEWSRSELGAIRAFLSGKDMPTPVHLRKNNDGIWKLFNVSSLATGVKRVKSGDF